MNKKLISKCCHSEVSESVYFTCLKCGQVCEVIEIEEWFEKAWEEYRQHIKNSNMDDMKMPYSIFKKYIKETPDQLKE